MQKQQSKKLLSILGLLLVSSSIRCLGETEVLRPPSSIAIPMFPFGRTLTPTSAIIVWSGPSNANNYDVVIFKAENKELILHQQIKNVHEKMIEFKDLEPSTNYIVKIKSVIARFDGTTQESDYSEAFSFTTRDACEGGKVHVSCTAHCTPTCEQPRPACDRRCVSGCSCPKDIPYWHKGKCVSKKGCKTAGGSVTEIVGRPTNLKLHRVKGSRDVLFTWNKVEGADYYTVIVSLKDGTIVQTIDDLKDPITLIKDLKPRTQYRFKVQAKFLKFSLDGGRDLPFGFPSPLAPTVSDVTATSFQVQWDEFPDTKSYKIALTNVETKEVVQVFKDITETNVKIQSLNPDTKYNVTIIMVTSRLELESLPSTVTTLSSEADSGDFLNPTVVTYVVTESTTTTAATPTTVPYIPTCFEREQATKLLLEVNGHYEVHVAKCVSDGNYAPTQCEKNAVCYCVDRRYGEKHPGSDFVSIESKYALDCSKYDQFEVKPLKVFATAINTESIRVNWTRDPNAAFYIVKIFNAYQGGFVTHVSGITRRYTIVKGLQKGTAYVAIVVLVSKDGRTSSDRVKGAFVATPFLDPPTKLKLEQVAENRMKASWTNNDIALHYEVEVFETGSDKPQTYDNVTENHVTFPIHGREPYKVVVKSTGVTTIPGTGKTVLVSSNSAEASRKPTCFFQPMDVIFVLDISDSMTPEEYRKTKRLFALLSVSLSPLTKIISMTTRVRIAAVKAHSTTKQVFGFSRYASSRNVIVATRNVTQSKTNYDLKEMVQFVHRNFWHDSSNKVRASVATAVVAFIGGTSVTTSFEHEARQLKLVTNVITIGVNGRTSEMDMSYVSDAPNRIMIDSYDDMCTAHHRVMERLCKIKKIK